MSERGQATGAGAHAPDPHLGLAPLTLAAAMARARITILRVPMHFNPGSVMARRPLALIGKLFVFMAAHLRLARELWRLRDQDLVIVREFLTSLLVLVWPLLWPLRGRVHFLVNHNLQEAGRRGFERRCLRLLGRCGCRFAGLELADGFAELGLPTTPERLLVLPHPLKVSGPSRPDPTVRRPVVGVVGEMRGEKNATSLLEHLAALRADGRLDVDLLLGCPDPTAAGRWRAEGFRIVDTTRLENYLGALDACDVVALNYERERYFWRASGVAADALARRAVVVCPDFPMMRHQLTWPRAVGATFGRLDDLAPALDRALALREGLDRALAAHERARNAAALAARLDAFIERRCA